MKLKFSLRSKTSRKSKKGFTLLELLIVMTVIGGLAAVVLVTFPGSRKRARDTQRKSDLKQYQTLMELYANREGSYLVTSGSVNLTGQCTNLNTTTCPDDPDTTKNYKLNSSASQYHMWAQLELPKQTGASKNYFLLCSNGIAKETVKAGDPAFSDCN